MTTDLDIAHAETPGTPGPIPVDSPEGLSRRTRWLVLVGILLLGLGLRLAGDFADLRFSYHGDELHFVKRSMAIGTGDLNPHWFHKPAFLMYLLTLCYGVYYLVGALFGAFGSVHEFGAYFLNEPGSFVLIGRLLVTAFGVASIYVVYRLGKLIFHSHFAGLVSAFVAAVLFPMAIASQAVKADVPAGFFVAVSFYWFLRARESRLIRTLAFASFVAGMAMGTKYYGAMLLPAYGLIELAGRWTRKSDWKTVLQRGAVVAVLFFAGFFVTSPFNFLDTTWARGEIANVQRAAGLGSEGTIFRADSDTEYRPGPGAFGGAAGHFVKQVFHSRAFGLALSALLAIGFFACLADPRRRAVTVALGLVLLMFAFMACTMGAYHISWRHFNAVAPLLCVLAYPGALAIARRFRLSGARTRLAGIALVVLAVSPSLAQTVAENRAEWEADSRTLAYEWIIASLPENERLLVDDYGPILQPSPASVRRQRARLEGLPKGEAFTSHQHLRLKLLEKYPGAEARDIDELGHPWWLNRERSDESLRTSWEDRDMGNPLKLRVPKSLAEFRAEGVRYVITNSDARARYFGSKQAEAAFPAWTRFYRELGELRPIKTFDPAELDAHGPVVWIYDLNTGQS